MWSFSIVEGLILSMYNIAKLDWDSQFFGYEIGRLDLFNEDLFDYVGFENAARAYSLVYIFSPYEIDSNYIKLVDKKVILTQKLTLGEIKSPLKDGIREFDKKVDSYNDLRTLVLQSGVFSRFFLDENFVNDEYNKLYTAWLDNSILDSRTKIFMAFDENKLMGFITLENRDNNYASIGLITVAEGARGKGIGTKLINRAINQSIIDKNDTIEVITQLDNKAAMNLYKKSNFTIKNINNIYHYWNYDTI